MPTPPRATPATAGSSEQFGQRFGSGLAGLGSVLPEGQGLPHALTPACLRVAPLPCLLSIFTPHSPANVLALCPLRDEDIYGALDDGPGGRPTSLRPASIINPSPRQVRAC